MASGIDGPGNSHLIGNNTDLRIDPDPMAEDSQTFLTTLIPMSSSTPCMIEEGRHDHATQEGNKSGEPEDVSKASDLPENHLSFANLMSYTAKSAGDVVERGSDVMLARRNVLSDPDVVVDTRGSHYPEAYNPSLHMDTSLNQEMEKVFEEGDDVPFQLKMDFANPAVAGETHAMPQQKYGEGDFYSHRRNVVHMYQPMATRLSSHDMKTIQSAHSSPPKSTSKRRRHRSSSSSGSSIGSPNSSSKTPNADKTKRKKGRKQKKNKRKPLTATMRNRTMSIPEENEEESEEDEESDVEKDDKDDDDDKEQRDKEESGKEQERDDDLDEESKDEETDGNEKNEKTPSPGQQHDAVDGRNQDKLMFIDEQTDATNANNNMAVLFTVGNEETPKPSTGNSVSPTPEKGGMLLPSKEEPSSFSSLQSGASSSSYSMSAPEGEKRDKLENLVDVKSDSKKKKHHHHHGRHRRKHHGMGLQRRISGSKLKEMQDDRLSKKITGYLDEDEVGDVDAEDIKSHRFEDRAGIRKHLLHRPVKKRKLRTQIHERKIYDRQPHEVFVELDELVSGEWKETARWIKFEEDVEESQKWGKPRVASLSFHSLLELRRTIEKGAVMLDLENTENISDVANALVSEMVNTGQIRGEDQGSILRILLSKHRHIPQETAFPYNYSKASISSFFGSPSYASRLNAAGNSSDVDGTKPLLGDNDIEMGDVKQHTVSQVPAVTITSAPSTRELKIMKKIPEGAEATAVLVGNVDYLDQPTMAFVRLAQGTQLEDVVALPIPVRFLFVLLGPSKLDYDYHEIGRSISTLMADQEFRVMAYAAENRNDLLRAINEFLDDSIVLPPGQLENPDLLRNISKYQKHLELKKKARKAEIDGKDHDEPKESRPPPEDPLKRTRKCFGGLIRDVKRRYPKYLSDITDAFNLQCLASIIFIYFAALSPAITFGGLLGEKTGGLMGVSEMVLGCCIAGCSFGLFSGQPMLIVGSTGPLLVFEEAVFNFCGGSNLPFLAVRVWIGLWIAIICFVVVAFEGSFLVRYVSRFTQEIFSALISLIFIYETFLKLSRIFEAHPLKSCYPCSVGNSSNISMNDNCSMMNDVNVDEETGQPNTALLSTLLMFGTFIIAYFLRQFKNSKFLRSSVRRTIGDFGVPIAIVVMLGLDLALQDTYTQKLNIPKGISPTNESARGWYINPLGTSEQPLPVWMIFASAIPALLVFILIFMESHITEMIVSKKERKLKKGTGFHLNLMVLGILNGGLSMFGMPWVCAAAVRSITHTNSLTIMSKTQAPGDKPMIEGLQEQRVTVFIVNACLGLSILMQPLLKEIPIAVLFGIFLYMGVTSLAGVQFIDRLEMLFMPSKHYPDFSYVKVVRPLRIHLFTFIEILCLVMLWVVKSTPAQIAFPFALVMTVPLRYFLLPKIFSAREIAELDSSDTRTSVTTSNMDEYNDAQMPD